MPDLHLGVILIATGAAFVLSGAYYAVLSDQLAAVSQATVRRVDGAQLAQWLAPAAGHALRDQLYVVDPMGNWMMRFPAIDPSARVDTASAARIKRDLANLMRASASWDKAGRP